MKMKLLVGILLLVTGRGFAEHHGRNKMPDPGKIISDRDTTPVAIIVTPFNRAAFYQAMEANNKQLVTEQLSVLTTAPLNIREAFTGAMLMKKAGTGGSAPSKLRTFKEGHRMLEAAIRKDPDNTEYRFLRLVVQEHAPSVLGYHNNTGEDSDFIRLHYKSLPDDVQQFIVAYSKKSKILKLQVS